MDIFKTFFYILGVFKEVEFHVLADNFCWTLLSPTAMLLLQNI